MCQVFRESEFDFRLDTISATLSADQKHSTHFKVVKSDSNRSTSFRKGVGHHVLRGQGFCDNKHQGLIIN
jgi:hypothetical protein